MSTPRVLAATPALVVRRTIEPAGDDEIALRPEDHECARLGHAL
ncbi:hypothetical protein AB4Y44_39925 [Paraburkholderia sp. BR10937]